MKATWAGDGRSFHLVSPGLTGFQAGFSATIERNGETNVLSSSEGVAFESTRQELEITPCGQATIRTRTFHFEKNAIDLLFRLGEVPGVPGVLVQAGIRNAGTNPVNLAAVAPVVAEIQVEGNPTNWLVTAMDRETRGASDPVRTLSDVHKPAQIREHGGFYRNDGCGFLFGPVGKPIAYMDTTVESRGKGRVRLGVVSEMSGVRVDPGEVRWGQQAVLWVEPPRKALPRWAAWVAATHGARSDKGSLSGWFSWRIPS